MNALPGLGRGLRLYHLMLSAQVVAHPLGDLPLRGLNVALVPGQDHHEFFLVIIIEHFVDPEVHTVKALLVREIIADDGCSGIAIVEGDHGAEAF